MVGNGVRREKVYTVYPLHERCVESACVGSGFGTWDVVEDQCNELRDKEDYEKLQCGSRVV